MFRLLRYWFLLLPLARVVWRLLRDRRVPLAVKALPVAAVLYLALPFDFVPDILPGLGHIDDLIVAIVLVLAFIVLSPWPVVLEHATGRPPIPPATTRGAAPSRGRSATRSDGAPSRSGRLTGERGHPRYDSCR
jgi:uncharacterized membrane protein YkvA (DUF1232 family)